MDCDFMIRTEQEDELMEMARKHLTDVHDTTMSRADPREAMRTVRDAPAGFRPDGETDVTAGRGGW